jgi:hypothetical protein
LYFLEGHISIRFGPEYAIMLKLQGQCMQSLIRCPPVAGNLPAVRNGNKDMKRYFSSNEGIGAVMTKAGPAASNSFGLPAKVTRSLCIVIVSCLLFGAVAFYAMSSVRDAFAAESSVGMPGIQSLYATGRAMMVIDGAENALLATDIDENKRRSIYSQFDTAKRSLDESLKAYEGLPLSAEESRLWKDFVRALERWGKDHERFVQLAGEHDQSRTTETYRSMSQQALEVNPASLSAAVSLLDALVEGSLGRRQENREIADTATFPYQEYIVQVVVVMGSILALAIIVLIASRFRRPRRRFTVGVRRLTLDVDTHGKVFSSARSAKKGEVSQ